MIAARMGSVIAAPTEKKRAHAVLAQAADVAQEGVAGAGRVAADQDVVAVAVGVGDLRQRQVEHGDVVGGGVRPGVARHGADRPALRRWRRGSTAAGGSRSVFFHVLAACSFSEWQTTIVASRSSTSPGIAYPATVEDSSRPVSAACAQATSRACARAARRAASAASSSAASTRHAVGSEATGPNRSGWLRSTARSEIASPPSASITARSTATRPGSCPESRCRNGASASDIAADRPVASARSASSRAPAWPTTPRPSAVTTILGREEVRFTLRVPFALDGRNLRQVPSSQVEGHFYVYGTLSPRAY